MVVIRGYLGLVEEAVLEWLPSRPFPRVALVGFLTETLGRMQDQADRLLARSDPTPDSSRHTPATPTESGATR